MISLETHAHRYPSPGRCVFCLKSPPEVELTNEHVIPLFLVGTGELIIENGACSVCNHRAGGTFERSAANADFLVPRLLLDLKRRNSKRKAPKHLPMVSTSQKDSIDLRPEDYDTVISRNQYPKMLSFVFHERPGVLVNEDKSGSLKKIRIVTAILAYTPFEGSVGMRHAHDHTATALTIAKIGYAFAAAERGVDTFDGSEIRSLIERSRDDVYNFVGSRPYHPTSKKLLHRLSLHEEGPFLVAVVHLFASARIPPYEVVVGRL